MLSPLLSVPHAAAAFGFAFLIAPSGWITRILSPTITGWDRPPDLLVLNDPAGLAMVAGLVVKEVPFLILMSIAALGQVDDARTRTITMALGYGRMWGWLKSTFPRVYAQIRLPVFVVLAYSMSVVDVALILGPTTPAPLAVQIVDWMSDPDLRLRTKAAAGALLQLALVVGTLGFWLLLESIFGRGRIIWTGRGGRGQRMAWLGYLGLGLGGLIAAIVLTGLAALAVWSIAGYWGFPDALPAEATLRNWQRHGGAMLGAAVETAWIALVATCASVVLTIGCLEAEYRHGIKMTPRSVWLLYLPLLVPQIAFLPGLQTYLIWLGVDVGRWPVAAVHVVFVLPYVFLSLADPWRAWDDRIGAVGAALGASPDRVLWRVRLPMLLRPVLIASAVGFAVSVGQYLPTLLTGGGRVQTLTTEALALASGGDRRAIGAFGLGQTLAALVPFAAAILLPRWIWRHRRGLRDV